MSRSTSSLSEKSALQRSAWPASEQFTSVMSLCGDPQSQWEGDLMGASWLSTRLCSKNIELWNCSTGQRLISLIVAAFTHGWIFGFLLGEISSVVQFGSHKTRFMFITSGQNVLHRCSFDSYRYTKKKRKRTKLMHVSHSQSKENRQGHHYRKLYNQW